MRGKLFLVMLVSIALMAITSATSCTPSSLTYQSGGSLTQTISCTGGNVNRTINVSPINSQISLDSTTIGSLQAKSFLVTFNPSAISGSYSSGIFFDDGSLIPVSLTVSQSTSSACNIEVFPTLLTNIRVKQGEVKTRNIQISIPSCFSNQVNIQGVSLQTDERPIQLGELTLGNINPGNSVSIPIEIDSKDVTSGTYSDTLQLLIYNSSGSRITLPSVSVSVLVTQGINPITNFSLSELPTCSLSSIEMNLNETYKLICNNPNPNIQITPIIDSNYIRGVSVENSAGQYTYTIKAFNIGTTIVEVKFVYQNGEIGNPFKQDVRITTSGSNPVSGTTMRFNYYQFGSKKELSDLVTGELTILLIDERTNSTINSFTLYLNGQTINGTNSFHVQSGLPYELIGSSNGYLSRTVNFTVSTKQLNIRIEPAKTLYDVGDQINITTEPENGTILLNNGVVPTSYTIPSSGNYTFVAKKEGYGDRNITIIVDSQIFITSTVPSEIKKGDDLYLQLNQNTTWVVNYQETATSEKKAIISGTSDVIKFNADKKGLWIVEADSKTILSKEVLNKTFQWYWIAIAVLVIVFIYFVFFYGKTKKADPLGDFQFSK